MIYFNEKLHYSSGFRVLVSDGVKVSRSEDGFLLYLDHEETFPIGSVVEFELEAKSAF